MPLLTSFDKLPHYADTLFWQAWISLFHSFAIIIFGLLACFCVLLVYHQYFIARSTDGSAFSDTILLLENKAFKNTPKYTL